MSYKTPELRSLHTRLHNGSDFYRKLYYSRNTNDMGLQNVSNVSSRCLYHKVIRKLSSESRGQVGRRGRSKRRRGGPRRVNYRESVWSKQIPASSALPIVQSEKELSSKYYKASLLDLPEKLESSIPKRDTAPRSSIVLPHLVESEEEVDNQLPLDVGKLRRNSLDKRKK